MQPRERMLAMIVGGMLAVVVCVFTIRAIVGMFDDRRVELVNLQAEVSKKKAKADAGKRAQARLKMLEQRSLPTNSELARSQYQSWLLGRLEASGMIEVDTTPQTGSPRKGIYEKFVVIVRGKATLDQVTKLMYDFYEANHLHQIVRMTAKPLEGTNRLDINMTVEALSLPGANRQDTLAEGKSDRLAHGEVAKYRDIIGKRNLFAPYSPLATARRDTRPNNLNLDPAKYARVTAIVESDQPTEVWVHMRVPTEKTIRLRQGQSFEVGDLKGTVTRIEPRLVEFLADGKRLVVPLGGNLREGAEPAADN